ncbi:lipopolysaccharide biosynthesis protein, partial [Terribacillus saccharophilus]|uniref:lipopolysaccharide biosynthesis protein n=1 Tax=Terribacillus saccharophilus TaxID=361277 RepID=UPI003981AE27
MRIKSSIKNLSYAVVGQTIGILISFISRLVFIQILGTEYLGINGLFTTILSILSLVELGLGPAMTYSLYDPLSKKNTETVKSLMVFYKKAYIFVGSAILILGVVFLPFLDFFVGNEHSISNIHLVFMLFVVNSAVSYFYSYKRSLIISDQKRYIATYYRYLF